MFDIIIIGSGIAGLTAALNAKTINNKVLVISKTYPTHSLSVQAQGGINAVLYENDDSVEQHIEDTFKASYNLSIKENIEFLCKNAKETVMWLDSIGVPFSRDENGNISQRKFGGTNKKRTCYSSDYTGLKILHTLYDRCLDKNIEFVNEHLVLDLIIDEDKSKGVIALDIVTGEIKEFISKVTILASGGYAGIYSNHTTNSYTNCGDGIALAYKAGAKLSNLEFIQFHPTTLENSNILISESARGEGAYLLDENGNRFINELASRDEISRAIYKQIEKNKKVYLDFRHLGLEKINKHIPQERKISIDFANTKIENELLSIVPSAHYTMGGVDTNINTETSIENLFSCGEVSQSYIHGANRLGGNSLLEVVLFGKTAGINAKNLANKLDKLDLKDKDILTKIKNKIADIYNLPNKINFYEKKEYLGKVMFLHLGLFRDEKGMKFLLEEIDKLIKELDFMGIGDKSKQYNKNLVEFIEFENILNISRLVTICAINRKESRGCHYRIDYPSLNSNFEKISSITKSLDDYRFCFEEIK